MKELYTNAKIEIIVFVDSEIVTTSPNDGSFDGDLDNFPGNN